MKVKILSKDRCYKETVDCIADALLKINISVELVDYKNPITDNFYIIVGKDLCSILTLPTNYIIVQLETLSDVVKEDIDKFLGKSYLHALQNAKWIWDHSENNINILQKIYKFTNIYHIPFYYSKVIDNSSIYSSKVKDYDIFFNEPIEKIPRRKELIEKLKKKYNIYQATNNIWNKEKLQALYRSKIVLHILYYETDLLELRDLNIMLGNKSFVISEANPNQPDILEKYIISVPYEKIESTIDTYLQSSSLLKEQKKMYQQWIQTDFNKAIQTFPLFKGVMKQSSKKKSKKKVTGIIDYYIPKPIAQVEVEKNIELQEIKLKLPYVEDDDLPFISIITPTKDRKFIFKLAIYNFLNANYPKEKLEWIIVNNGTEDLTDILPDDKRINYITVEPNKYSLGELRNICIENCKHDYIVYMDDDDYYHVNSYRARIQCLLKYKNQGIECVGCDDIGFFNVMNGESTIGNNEHNYLGEASMAHTKQFWLERKYGKDKIGEYKHFLLYRQHQILNIPYEFIMIAINHNVNTTGLNRFKKKEMDETWKSSDYKEMLFQYFNEDVQQILLESIKNRTLIIE